MTSTRTVPKKSFAASRPKLNRVKVAKIIKKIVIGLFRYTLIFCLAFMILYPLLRMISNAIVHPHVIGSVGSFWIPQIPSLDNFRVAFAVMNFWPVLRFTMINITGIMLLQIINAAFAGYAFARLRFRGSGLLFGIVLLTFVVPTQTLFLPQFVLFRNFDIFGIITLINGEPLNLIGEPTAMFVIAGLGQGIAGGLFIYIFRQFFRGLPKELEEAAYVDGAGVLRTFFTIVIPMAKPAFLTVGTLSFIWNWNDNFFPSIFHPTNMFMRVRIEELNRPTPGGTSIMQQSIGFIRHRLGPDVATLATPVYDATIINVANLISVLPLIVLFLLVQRQFVQGVERSGIVG